MAISVSEIRAAAEEGNEEAQFNLGIMYDFGEGVPADDRKAVYWYRLAAEQGHAGAQFFLGTMYDFGEGVPADDREAVHWYRLAAEQGHADAQFYLGAMYDFGEGVPADDREAVHWYRLAAEQGHADAQFYLGASYKEGAGVSRDVREAARWYLLAAKQGNADAQYNLGDMYDSGEGVPRDMREAVRWFRLAAGQGDSDAQYRLGVIFDGGNGVLRDVQEAVHWYGLAAEQGHAGAQYSLGNLYDSGGELPRDPGKAVRWFRLSAEQDNDKAQFRLGFSYYEGKGVPQDFLEAARWLRLAAERGHPEAQLQLGYMHEFGEGMVPNPQEAVRMYRLAAEQGNPSGQFNLGNKYLDGEAVSQDHQEAALWHRLAAEQGHSKAQLTLGIMYVRGWGVPQDLVQAYKWVGLAAPNSPKAKSVRDAIGAELTSSELLEAERLTGEWQRAHAGQSTAGDSEVQQRVARVQRALAFLGYDVGTVNGILGARTQFALEAFRYDHNLPDTDNLFEDLEMAVLMAAGSQQEDADSEASRESGLIASGSGFRVSEKGHILTNAHVVEGCSEVKVTPGMTVRISARDSASDLALLAGPAGRPETVASFRAGRGVRPGDSVLIIGFPLRGVLASEPNVTLGNISALAGPGDDRRLIQLTAPIQQGNSGGPVLDLSGNAVGVVVSKLDAVAIARATGDIPQNINFAVGAGVARSFLDAESVPYILAASEQKLAPADVAASARRFTVAVECWNDGPEGAR